MAQTQAGALKIAAKKAGITVLEYLQKVAEGLKRCIKCKTWKDLTGFGSDRSRHDGKSASCLSCCRVKERKCCKGRPSAFKGRKHTDEARAKMGAARKGKPSPLRGRTLSSELRARLSKISRERTPRGKDHYAYSHGKHQRDLDERRSVEYREWRTAVFKRDGYTCQHCGDARGGNLQAHHVKEFADYPELRFVVENGLTLCQSCHEKIHLKPIPTNADLRRRKKHV